MGNCGEASYISSCLAFCQVVILSSRFSLSLYVHPYDSFGYCAAVTKRKRQLSLQHHLRVKSYRLILIAKGHIRYCRRLLAVLHIQPTMGIETVRYIALTDVHPRFHYAYVKFHYSDIITAQE